MFLLKQWRKTVVAADSYGALLVLIAGSLLTVAVLPLESGVVAVVLQAITLCYAQWTSRISPRLLWVSIGIGAIAIAASGFGILLSDREVRGLAGGFGCVLSVSTVVIVLRRLTAHPVISRSTVAGALCVYGLVGLSFAYLFAFSSAAEGHPFFSQTQVTKGIDLLYFSFTTLTTLGYGDFTAATNTGRILAVSEAIFGQLYLVTVVALVVSRVGQVRPGKKAD